MLRLLSFFIILLAIIRALVQFFLFLRYSIIFLIYLLSNKINYLIKLFLNKIKLSVKCKNIINNKIKTNIK